PIERELQNLEGDWYLRRVLPYRTADDRIDGVVITYVDITRSLRAETAQREGVEEYRMIVDAVREYAIFMLDPAGKVIVWNAGAASDAKDQFLAVVSHELRTPLSVILLWTKMIQTSGLPKEEMSEGISAIESSAEAQKQLIEDLLDTTRISSGKLRLNMRETDLVEVTRAAINTIRPTADTRGVRIKEDYGKDIG